jgi:hypothetical protein
MPTHREPTDTEKGYREAQRGTVQYQDLVKEYLEQDLKHLASLGQFDEAIKSRFSHLAESGRLDREIRQTLLRALRKPRNRFFSRLGWVGPFALGVALTATSAGIGFWGARALSGDDSGGGETTASERLAGEGGTQNPGPSGPGSEAEDPATGAPGSSEPSLNSAGDVLALFDEKFPADPDWFDLIVTGLRAEGTEELVANLDQWQAGEDFDTTRVRSGMALWVLAENGWPVDLDGSYGPECRGTNCPIIRSTWWSTLDLQGSSDDWVGVLVPSLPADTIWREPAVALAPFEKYLIVQHLVHR